MELQKDSDKARFKQARNGDHLMVPFQCDACHHVNLTGRWPNPLMAKDQRLLWFIRRAHLDAFWSREPSTVRSNLVEMRRCEVLAQDLGIAPAVPPLGPFKVTDDGIGMRQAVVLLKRSMDPGRYEEYVQFATFRKARASFTNIFQASAGGLSSRVGAYERHKIWITDSPTFGFFFT